MKSHIETIYFLHTISLHNHEVLVIRINDQYLIKELYLEGEFIYIRDKDLILSLIPISNVRQLILKEEKKGKK